jgi:hypothetical protein
MKFCPVVPEICHGKVHDARNERRITRYDYNLTISDRSSLEEQFCVFKIFKMSAIFKMAAKTRHKNGG